jgi:hypothetical protein
VTTIFEEEVTCAVCGAKQTVQEMGSTSSFGPMDLDTRPPPLQRGTMEMWVHRCTPVEWTFRYPLPKTRSKHVPVCSHSVSRLVTVFGIGYRKVHTTGAKRSAMSSSSRLVRLGAARG